MGSDVSDSDYRSRRRKYDEEDEVPSSRKRRHGDGEDGERARRRDKSRSTSRKREKRDSSEPPDASRRRSRDRKRDHDSEDTRERHRHRRRHRSRSRDGDRDKEGSSSRRHRSSRSPERSSRRHHRHHIHRSASPNPPKQIDYPSSPKPAVRRAGPLPSQDADFAVSSGLEPVPEKEKPNFRPTGALAAAANSVTASNGETVTLKYHEPPEARKAPPRDKWKMFVFKGKDVVDTIELSLRSCWLVGRDRAVVDLPAEHPSISKQHAVVQFRYVEKRNEFGDRIGKVKPYLIDLESANGTVLNGDKVPESRYLEVRDRDVIRFGLSEREYVVMLDRE